MEHTSKQQCSHLALKQYSLLQTYHHIIIIYQLLALSVELRVFKNVIQDLVTQTSSQ